VVFQNDCGGFWKRLRWFSGTTAVDSETMPLVFGKEGLRFGKGCPSFSETMPFVFLMVPKKTA